MEIKSIGPEDVLSPIETVFNSNGDILCDADLQLHVTTIRYPRGAGRSRGWEDRGKHFMQPKDKIRGKTAFVTISNSDQLCFARSLAVALAKKFAGKSPATLHGVWSKRHTMLTHLLSNTNYKSVRKGYSIQTSIAHALHKLADVPQGPVGLNEIIQFEKALKVRICVFSAFRGGDILYIGSKYPHTMYLYLVEGEDPALDEGHFHCIIDLHAYKGCQEICGDCKLGYKGSHTCAPADPCGVCHRAECKLSLTPIECTDCHLIAKSQECLAAHRAERSAKTGKKGRPKVNPPICGEKYRCLDCEKIMVTSTRPPDKHVCGEFKCTVCFSYVQHPHLCYHRAEDPPKHADKIIYADFECSSAIGGSHVPVLVVSQTSCNKCQDNAKVDASSKCDFCGQRCRKCNVKYKGEYQRLPCNDTCGFRQKIHSDDRLVKDQSHTGKDVQTQFGDWLFTPDHRNTILCFHNASGYDAYPVLAYALQNGIKPVHTIFRGSRVLYLQFRNGIKIIDSCLFIPAPLKHFPDMLGLNLGCDEEDICKGYFPWKAIRPEYFTYKGPLLDKSHYGVELMMSEDRAEFDVYYESHKDDEWNFKDEIVKYCQMDVTILRMGCTAFRKMLIDLTSDGCETGVDPDGHETQTEKRSLDAFTKTTLASTAMGVFKTKHFEEEWVVLLKTEDELAQQEQRKPQWLQAK